MNAYYRSIGGTDLYLYHLTKELEKKGYTITVICTTQDFSGKRMSEPGLYIDRNGTKISREEVRFRMFQCPVAPSIINKVLKAEDIDIINSVFTHPFIGDLPIILGKIKGLPTIVHYIFETKFESMTKVVALQVYDKTLGYLSLRCADKIICWTKSYADASDVLRHFIGKVEVIPPAIDIDLFNPRVDGSRIRRQFGVGENDPLLLFVGRIVRFKGIKYLISAFLNVLKKLPTAKLIIIGDGALRSILQCRCQQLNLQNIIFTGFIPHNSLPQYYAACDMLILPSIRWQTNYSTESFGLVLLEAMATGKPVIASKIPGVNSVFLDGEHGLYIKQGSVKQLSEAILNLIENEKLRESLGKQARRYVEENYSWSKVCSKIMDIYKEVCEH